MSDEEKVSKNEVCVNASNAVCRGKAQPRAPSQVVTHLLDATDQQDDFGGDQRVSFRCSDAFQY